MTAPNQWTSEQLSTLQSYVDTTSSALAAKDLAAAKVAIASYDSEQAAWGRGYANLAETVVTNTTSKVSSPSIFSRALPDRESRLPSP